MLDKSKRRENFQEEPIYISLWDESEKEIEYIEENNVKFHRFPDKEFGISLCGPDYEDILNSNESAILFGNDISTLYLRASFSYLIKLNIDEDDNDMLKLLYKLNTGLVVINSELYYVPVYKNSSDLLELEFSKIQEPEPEHIMQESIQTQKSDDATVYEELKNIINNEINRYNGEIQISSSKFDEYINPFDLLIIKNQYVLVVYDKTCDSVLSEEYPLYNENPTWFTESQHYPSPIYQARCLASFLIKNTRITQINGIVLFSNDCEILNMDELKKTLSLEPKVDILKSFVADEDELNYSLVDDYFYSLSEGEDFIKINTVVLEQLKTDFIEKFKSNSFF